MWLEQIDIFILDSLPILNVSRRIILQCALHSSQPEEIVLRTTSQNVEDIIRGSYL